MKKERKALLALIVLAVVTVIAAAVHLSGRIAPEEGMLYIEQGENTVEFPISELELKDIQGSVVNGKGEVREINGQGILLSEVLANAGVCVDSQITVTADDEYSVLVTAEELSAADKVYLILQNDGGIQMVVFGDANSKRNVSDIVRLTVQ